MSTDFDSIARFSGIAPGSTIDEALPAIPAARESLRTLYAELFEQENPTGMSLTERLAVALFIAGVCRHDGLQRHYADKLDDSALETMLPALGAEITAGRDVFAHPEAAAYTVSPGNAANFGPRLTAALEYAMAALLRPRAVTPGLATKLGEAGWSRSDAATLVRLLAFLSYQIFTTQGFALLASIPCAADTPA